MTMLTYLQFHLLFLLPPIVGLGILTVYRADTWDGIRPFTGLGVLILLAVLYTTPWDNILIANGVWWYGDWATLIHFWEAPLGEYLFFILQPILVGLWVFQFPRLLDYPLRAVIRTHRLLGIGAGLAISVVGYLLLAALPTYYLGAILLWAGPILAIQWGFGWPYLWKLRRTVLVYVVPPTLYLGAIDRIAIELGIWQLSGAHTTGVTVGGLPVEEGLFFLLTTVFSVQTLLLYMWLCDRVDRGELREWTLVSPGSDTIPR